MAKKETSDSCCSASTAAGCNFKVESILNVDERGQMVLPKEVRERAGIQISDKLALISWEKNGSICCMCLIKTDELADMFKIVLGPMIQEVAPD